MPTKMHDLIRCAIPSPSHSITVFSSLFVDCTVEFTCLSDLHTITKEDAGNCDFGYPLWMMTSITFNRYNLGNSTLHSSFLGNVTLRLGLWMTWWFGKSKICGRMYAIGPFKEIQLQEIGKQLSKIYPSVNEKQYEVRICGRMIY